MSFEEITMVKVVCHARGWAGRSGALPVTCRQVYLYGAVFPAFKVVGVGQYADLDDVFLALVGGHKVIRCGQLTAFLAGAGFRRFLAGATRTVRAASRSPSHEGSLAGGCGRALSRLGKLTNLSVIFMSLHF